MSATESDNQPTVAIETEQLDYSSDAKTPDVKSGVYNDPTAAMNAPTARFFKNDKIHMSEKINNVRSKGSYEIYKSRHNRDGFIEYQLVYPGTRNKYNGGDWYRENLLKLEERAR